MNKITEWFKNLNTLDWIAIILIIVAFFGTTFFFGYEINISERKIFHLNFLAILLGLIFEFKRLSIKWSTVIYSFLGSYLVSFFSFLPGKNERIYSFEEHLEDWPFIFLIVFIIIAIAFLGSKVIIKLTEGITLLLTLSFIYWLIANHYIQTENIYWKVTIGILLLFSIFPIFNAFTNFNLSNNVRLTLSIWSALITLILALDNFWNLFQFNDIEHLSSEKEKIIYFIQFFFLGISSMYIVQNIFMLIAYLPGRDFFKNVSEMNQEHIERYSDNQVFVIDSIIVTIISIIGFTFNYNYNIIPINLMIWFTITIIPLFLLLIHKFLG